jgi:hypothetical protein
MSVWRVGKGKAIPVTGRDLPLLLSKRRSKEEENKNNRLGSEQIYGHESKLGPIPRVTVLAACQ